MFFKIMKSIENNFDDPKVNELLNKHFIELRSVSPEGSSHVLDIPGLKDPSIRFWSLWDEEELIGCGAPHPINSSSSHKLQNLILGSLRPGISNTWELPSGETDLNSIKCLFKSSFTLGSSKLFSIDFIILKNI